MQNNQHEQNTQRYEEDEIDLRELFRTLLKNKNKIFIMTLVIIIGAIVYVFLKNPTPVYSGRVMIEVGVGVGVGETPNQIYFDNTNNLKSIIEEKFDALVTIPKGTNNILLISSDSSNKDAIKKSLKNVVEYVLQKHTDKLKLYDKYIMTKQISEIKVGSEPINTPKKNLIISVAFVTGLILSIFLVFFMEFIKGFKEEEKPV